MAYPPYYGAGYPGAPPAYPGGPTGYPGYPAYPAAAAAYPAAYPAAPAVRSYYYIRSRLNGLVLDIEGDNRNPGARVIMWNQKPGNCDNQLWYDDPTTGTIRSKMHDFCLDSDGNAIVVRPFYPGNANQQWERADPFIRNRVIAHKVLDIANNNSSPGAHLLMWDRNGGANQCFDIQFIAAEQKAAYPVAMPSAPPPRRYFYIASEMHHKVLDIKGGSSVPGTPVIVWPRKSGGECRNQLWYFDEQGIIRSALNDYALEARGVGDQVYINPFGNTMHQQWRYVGKRIMKNQHECLDISGENKSDGAHVISYGYKGSANQHWHIKYV